jgi:OPA family glycerol-6-phosphate transporter-like MFS transporter 4
MTKKKSKKSNTRIPVLLFYMLLLFISMHLFVYYINPSSSSILINLIGLLAGFSNQGPITIIGIMAMEFAPKSLSGTSHAIVTLAANLGAICAGLPFSLLSKFYSWKFSFAIMQYIILAAFVFLFKFRNYDSKFEIEDKTKKTKVQ